MSDKQGLTEIDRSVFLLQLSAFTLPHRIIVFLMVFPLISNFSVSKKQERHKRERDRPLRKNAVIFNGRALVLR